MTQRIEGASMKAKLPLKEAKHLARRLVSDLWQYCDRIEVAGSIRRGKPEIGDIEIVAIPKYAETDLFGGLTGNHALDTLVWSNIGELTKGGHKYKQIALFEGINLDLFIVTPPAQFGVIYLIRTGPAAYSHKMGHLYT